MTAPDAYPLPHIETLISEVAKAKYISTLDLTKGYYQLKVQLEDRPKTAFVTPGGKWEFVRMPFGLKNAPAHFQRAMDNLIQTIPQTAVLIFIDDMVICTDDWESHLKTLYEVLEKISTIGLTIKPKKCFLVEIL